MAAFVVYKTKDNKPVTKFTNLKQVIYFLNKHMPRKDHRNLWVRVEENGKLRELNKEEEIEVYWGTERL
jgi:hypothetical protein